VSSTFIRGSGGEQEGKRSIYDKITRVSHDASGSSQPLLFQAISDKFSCTPFPGDRGGEGGDLFSRK